MSSITLNTSVKAHLLLGGFIALWLVLFQILIAPFDVADLSIKNRLVLIPPYGFILVACYALVIAIQNWWYSTDEVWSVSREIVCIVLLYIVLLPACWAYYTTDLINGTYGFSEFTLYIFLPIAIIFSGFIIMGRMYLNKLQKKKEDLQWILKGSNQNEVLRLDPEQLICVSSALNYVEVFYLLGNKVQKQLLRASLKNIQTAHPDLVQIHRSHLVNIHHFVTFKDKNAAVFYTIELPLSKKYKNQLTERLQLSP